jgi:TusA-related sulfurtransferase
MGNGEDWKIDRTLDTLGYFCPEPVVRTRMEIKRMKVGEILEVLADDPGSFRDIPRFVERVGQQLLLATEGDSFYRFLIKKIKD